MSVRVQDFTNAIEARSTAELLQALKVRQGDANSFWLSHNTEKNPALSLLVRGDLAYAHYFPSESHPGFTSVGTVQELPVGGATVFFLDTPSQEQEILNNSVIRLPEALEVAKEFFVSKQLPTQSSGMNFKGTSKQRSIFTAKRTTPGYLQTLNLPRFSFHVRRFQPACAAT